MNALADRFEILELLNRHQITIDLRDPDGYADLFASAGRFESPFGSAEGRAELREMTLALHEAGFTDGKRHLTGPATVEVDGDEARAFSYWWVAETEKTPGVYSTGTYTDALRKIDGRWRIVHRRQEIDANWPGSEASSAS